MLRVGLTGGIGSGKSELSRRPADHGAVIIDADLAARKVVARARPGRMPESFMPPNGARRSRMMKQFTHMVPVRTSRAIRLRYEMACLESAYLDSARPSASRWLICAGAWMIGHAKQRRSSPLTRCTGPATDTAAITARSLTPSCGRPRPNSRSSRAALRTLPSS